MCALWGTSKGSGLRSVVRRIDEKRCESGRGIDRVFVCCGWAWVSQNTQQIGWVGVVRI